MATETLQYEKQAVQAAQQELTQAKEAFVQQMQVCQAAADDLVRNTFEYVSKRKFWLA